MNTPRIMKKLKRALPVAMAIVLGSTAAPLVVRADSSKVVTLGANLTDSQKNSMYEYFGTSSDKAEIIEVTNADERKYLEGVAPDEQIGTRTYSCSYVEPTTSGGIQVKVSNLTYVTSSMISSTLLTSGVKNCNVVAASPIEVSGTGALTGIMMAYEKATGTTLNDDQKAAATDELVTTGDLANDIGQDKAENVMNDVKKDVIEGKLTDADDIQNAVENAAKDNNVTLTQEQIDKISDLMKNISQYDYDVKALKNTLDNIDGKSGGFFSNLWSSIKGIFGGDDSSDGGIINGTDDSALGDDVVTNSTLDSSDNSSNSTDSSDAASDAASDDTSDDNSDDSGFWGKIKKFFKDLFGGSNSKKDDTDKSNDDAITEDNSDNTDEPSGDTQNDSMNNDADSSDDGTTDNSADDSSLNDSTDNQSDNQSNTQNSSESDASGSDASGSDASDSSANSSSNLNTVINKDVQ